MLSGATQFECSSTYPPSQVFSQGGHGVPSLARGLAFAAGLGSATFSAGGPLPSLLIPGLASASAPAPGLPMSADTKLRLAPFVGVDPKVANGAAAIYCVDVTASTLSPGMPLSIALVWTDPPGSPLATIILVNNLDLEVTPAGGQTRYGNNNASHFPQVPDALNNVEKVYLPTPAPTLGAGGARLTAPYTVLVRGTRVPLGPQAFSLVVTGPGVALAPAGTAGCGSDPAAPPAAAATASSVPIVTVATVSSVLGIALLAALVALAWALLWRPRSTTVMVRGGATAVGNPLNIEMVKNEPPTTPRSVPLLDAPASPVEASMPGQIQEWKGAL